MFCLYCGASAEDGAKVCPKCGSTFLVAGEPDPTRVHPADKEDRPENSRDIYSSAPHRFREEETDMEDIFSGEQLPVENELAQDKAAVQNTVMIDRYADGYEYEEYEAYEEEVRRPKKKKRGWIVAIILAVLLAALIGGGVYGYLWYNAPEKQFARALEADDYAQITQLLPKLEDSEREALAGNMKAYAAQAVQRYNNGEVEYSVAYDLVDRLQRLFPDSLELQEAAQDMKTLKASKENFAAAQDAAQANDVENALRLFGAVSEKDTNYKAAVAHIDAVKADYKVNLLKEVQALADAGDFLGAQAKLTEGGRILGEDADITEKAAELTGMEQDNYVTTMLETAEKMADEGDLTGAVQFLQEATKEDDRLVQQIETYKAAYKSEKLKEAEEHAKIGDYEEAVAVLENTKAFLGEDGTVEEKIKAYKELYPKLLVDMSPTGGANCSSVWSATGVDGNAYSNGLSFALYPEVSETVETTYAPDGKYKRLSGTWVVESNSTEGFIGKIRVYVDGALQYELSSLTTRSSAKEMNLLISGAKEIRIEAEGAFTDPYQVGYIYLAGATFRN